MFCDVCGVCAGVMAFAFVCLSAAVCAFLSVSVLASGMSL